VVFNVSKTVKNLALGYTCVVSATASAGVTAGYRSGLAYLFSLDISTHMYIQILSEFFFGATTMGAHHSVHGFCDGRAMIPWLTRSSCKSVLRYTNGIVRAKWLGVIRE
jgi:hypothetical protein